MPVNSIRLAVGLTDEHQLALLKSITNPVAANPQERQNLLDGIDLLRSSHVEIDGQTLTFANFFDRFIDAIYTDQFIALALESKQIVADGQRHKKIFPNWPADFSQPVTFDFRGTNWVAVSYQIWKNNMLIYQQQGEESA